jgi:glyceraldehyde-3-phosphate dehydrogenase (NADP+)
VDASANLDWAVKRALVGAFAYAGQVCISVQRIFLHESIAEAFETRFAAGAAQLKVGDPADEGSLRRSPRGRKSLRAAHL